MPRMSVDSPLEHRIRQRLADLDAAGLRRSLQVPGGIDLCSNDYLGLARHPRLISRFAEGVRREGGGSTGSRLLRGERDCFRAVEERFARFKGTERALYFGSGYLANLAVLTTLAEASDVILSDERNHASLIDGARLSRARKIVFPHNDPRALAERLADTGSAGVRFVVVESLFSMDGDEAPLTDIVGLAEKHGAMLMVDEAHATGVYEPNGAGLVAKLGLGDRVLIQMGTLGKALGGFGAYVAGSKALRELLINRCRSFVFTTSLPPAVMAMGIAAIDLVKKEPERRQRLRDNSEQLRAGLKNLGFTLGSSKSQILPLIVGDATRCMKFSEALLERGVFAQGIRPPTVPAGTSRLRITLMATHTRDHVDQALAVFKEIAQEFEDRG
jgi:8-amino-7-oxononanoate synthase